MSEYLFRVETFEELDGVTIKVRTHRKQNDVFILVVQKVERGYLSLLLNNIKIHYKVLILFTQVLDGDLLLGPWVDVGGFECLYILQILFNLIILFILSFDF